MLAEEVLATGKVTIDDIAERLGYGETSNLLHSSKRWTGFPRAAICAIRAALVPSRGRQRLGVSRFDSVSWLAAASGFSLHVAVDGSDL